MGLMVPIVMPFAIATVPVSCLVYDITGVYSAALLMFEIMLAMMLVGVLLLTKTDGATHNADAETTSEAGVRSA